VAAFQLFVCFSSQDESVAREVARSLETGGLKCWISARDVLPGHNFQEAIVTALEKSSGIVFLFSDHSAKSTEIRKELALGGSFKIPVFPLRLSPVVPSGALRYELATRQWIDIFPDRERALVKLARTIKSTLSGNDAKESEAPQDRPPAARAETAAALVAEPPASKKPRAPIIPVGGREFEAIRGLLARRIGPIAKVLVEKAAREARTPDEFCNKLAKHVAAPPDRHSFVRAVREQLAVKP
jgi:TIR domain